MIDFKVENIWRGISFYCNGDVYENGKNWKIIFEYYWGICKCVVVMVIMLEKLNK